MGSEPAILERMAWRLEEGDVRLDGLECLQVCRSLSAVMDGHGCNALSS